jgi:hypothetical protein
MPEDRKVVRVTVDKISVEKDGDPGSKGRGEMSWKVVANGNTFCVGNAELGDGDERNFENADDATTTLKLRKQDMLALTFAVRERDNTDADDLAESTIRFFRFDNWGKNDGMKSVVVSSEVLKLVFRYRITMVN